MATVGVPFSIRETLEEKMKVVGEQIKLARLRRDLSLTYAKL